MAFTIFASNGAPAEGVSAPGSTCVSRLQRTDAAPLRQSLSQTPEPLRTQAPTMVASLVRRAAAHPNPAPRAPGACS